MSPSSGLGDAPGEATAALDTWQTQALAPKGLPAKDLLSGLERLNGKRWRAGYAWVKQRFGAGASLPDTYLDTMKMPQGRRLVYPLTVAGDLYGVVLVFGGDSMLSKVLFLP